MFKFTTKNLMFLVRKRWKCFSKETQYYLRYTIAYSYYTIRKTRFFEEYLQIFQKLTFKKLSFKNKK